MQIADVLAKVNRQMLLIFKTNDLLRAMEHTLGTQNAMAGFVQMSKSCIRCVILSKQTHAHVAFLRG